MDQFRVMQIFKAVADARSFTQAAEQLDLPRPTVTNAVQAIEQKLGVRLLQRTTRKVSLTVEGMIYLDRCTALLSELEDVNALFLGDGRRPSGTIRVDLPERVAHRTVIPALPGFLRQYPDIDVRLGSSDRMADLAGEGIDCAIRGGVLRDSTLIARRLGDMEQINVAARSYLELQGRPQTPAELARHQAVNYFSSMTGRDQPWEYVDEHGAVKTLALRSRVSVSSTEAYLAACRAGLGLIQMPRAGVEGLLASGELEEVLPQWKPAPLPVSIVYAHNRHLSPRVRVFVDWLAHVMQLE
jgi:LysR family transcriptional regulator, regulator for bpeEF and oprC